ncbi:ATP-dependent RecD-like DNA helicase [Candidatus Xenohaliotis californiensis]|uniref:ATP-dependent RecD2 DNA helicase n=1 Tax=Candidatus Xenohaliotis californiensis TaxID=84677 RepID=A0ABP0EUM7_9RICK|nr:ATP-dependent RecD-like DNA helicase [Candidatus Xenohaliotis californiensis]
MHHVQNIDKEYFLSGSIESVIFHNVDNAFTVIRIKSAKHKNDIIAVGEAPPVSAGEDVEISGIWVNDKNHGLQLKIKSIKTIQPTTPSAIAKYLGSGIIKGIGPKFAEKLVDNFGVKILEVIESSPEALKKIYGIGEKRIAMLTTGWQECKTIREIMLFLYSHGISPSMAQKIYKKYGNDAIETVSKNPYILAKEIKGIGFLSADKIANKFGFSVTSAFRIKAGIDHCLLEATNMGSCGLPKENLINSCIKLLNLENNEFAYQKITNALQLQIDNDQLTHSNDSDTELVFLKAFHVYESQIAEFIISLYQHSSPKWMQYNKNNHKIIAQTEKALSISLESKQKQAIKLALESKVLVITGGPGTGKTTILKTIVNILDKRKLTIRLCAPTGRAAKRLQETTMQNATTIHKTLGIDQKTRKFIHNAENKLQLDMLIVDEASMIDVPMANALVKALPNFASLILVGDIDQLPSVGAGKFLLDIINSETIPVVRLMHIFRQQHTSNIVINAHNVNQGKMLAVQKKGVSDFYFIPIEDRNTLAEKIIEIATKRIPKAFGFNPKTDLCILSPMKRGSTGTVNLNNMLQDKLNVDSNAKGIIKYGQKFVVGDKVMQIENNYDKKIFNGEIGFITDINSDDDKLIINFENELICYSLNELDQITLAYAITIHKSQGSEYSAVIIPITMQHYPMLKRNLLYTAITRSKKLVIIIGEKKALAMCIKTKDTKERYSQLDKFLKKEVKDYTSSKFW